MTEHLDEMVENYLASVDRALAALPAYRRTETITDLREHITAERTALEEQTPASVLEILRRLGDPEDIARSELGESPTPKGVVAGPARSRRPSPRAILLGLLLAGLVLLLVVAGVMALFFSAAGGPSAPAGPSPPSAPGRSTTSPQ